PQASFLSHMSGYDHLQSLHFFPTRRSSDLKYHHKYSCHNEERSDTGQIKSNQLAGNRTADIGSHENPCRLSQLHQTRIHKTDDQDRKSTRLNSSHVSISYAVFCLKKKIAPH